MSSKGYLCIAQNSGQVDYLRQAYALALSLKRTQSVTRGLAVAVDEPTKRLIKNHHIDVFEHIVDIPWMDHAAHSTWKIENKWKYIYMTPYDETVMLDADMVFTTDVSQWWTSMSRQSVCAATQVRNYRGDVADNSYYRAAFLHNNLPNIYTAFMYFKKDTVAYQLFELTEVIFNHWQRVFYRYLNKSVPEALSGDVAFALAIKLLDIEHLCTNSSPCPTFVHMKSRAQDINSIGVNPNWTKSLPTYFSNNGLVIGNFRQHLPFHYVEPCWLTDDIVRLLEDD